MRWMACWMVWIALLTASASAQVQGAVQWPDPTQEQRTGKDAVTAQRESARHRQRGAGKVGGPKLLFLTVHPAVMIQ